MKRFLQIMLCLAIAGLLFGLGLTQVSTKPFAKKGQLAAAEGIVNQVKLAAAARSEAIANRQQPNASAAKYPNAICEEPHFDFGTMDPLTVGSHTFRIENRGSAALTIQGGASSCKCTLSDLATAVIEPGAAHEVTLTWNSGHARQAFQQSATVKTNDPANREIELRVSGQVRAVIAAQPQVVNLDRLVPSTPKVSQLAIYSQVWEAIDIERLEVTSPHLTAELLTDASFDQTVARDDEILKATSRAVIQITYDGEAPAGQLVAKLRAYVRPPAEFDLNRIDESARLDSAENSLQPQAHAEPLQAAEAMLKELPEIGLPVQSDGLLMCEISIVGEVVNRVGLYGPQVKSAGLIDLGKVKARESAGKEWTIVLRIRGEQNPQSVIAKIDGIPGLSVDVEDTSTSRAKNSYRLRLRLNEQVAPGIYDRQTAGKLRIETAGLLGNEVLELPVHLDVL